MAGHSKWANIKRQKARVDAVKGKAFTKISRELIVAARQGADPEGNFQLRTAIEKAKAVGMPNNNIDRAIAKGAGKFGADEDALEGIRYEGYGPGGVAVLIEALTDNRNRTAADLRAAFSKNGGNLGETGCVGWMFAQKGVAVVVGDLTEDDLLEASVEGGAEACEPFEGEDDKGFEISGFEVKTEAGNLEALVAVLRTHGFRVDRAELRWVPDNTLVVEDPDQARSLLKMMDAIEDLDDVQSVTANFDMADDLLAVAMG